MTTADLYAMTAAVTWGGVISSISLAQDNSRWVLVVAALSAANSCLAIKFRQLATRGRDRD